MRDSQKPRLVIPINELAITPRASRLEISSEEVRGRTGWAVPASMPQSNRRVAFAALALTSLVVCVLLVAAIVTMRSPVRVGDISPRSVRAPDDGELRLIEKGQLGLVAPSVTGQSGGFLPSSWQGTAVPWRLDRAGRLVLVTNRHVSTGNESGSIPRIEVEFEGGRRAAAVAIGIAADPHVDLSLIVVETDGLIYGQHYLLPTPANDAEWNRIETGDPTVAVGNSRGFPQTQTFGRISALRDGLSRFDHQVRWLQIDCTVLPGNSGGPLLKADGEEWRWIGVVTARGNPGIGFAIFTGEIRETEYRWILGNEPEFDAASASASEKR